LILSKRLRVGPAGGAVVTLTSGFLASRGCCETGCLDAGCLETGCLETGCLDTGCLDTGCLKEGCLLLASSDSPPGCLNVDTIGFLLTGAGGDLLVVVFEVGGSLWFSRSTGFSSTGPMLMFPANEGTVFLPSESPTIWMRREILHVFLFFCLPLSL